jgi:hypothetical protein
MVTPYSYWFPDGTSGCVMAYNKAHAISTIIEFNPSQRIVDLTLHIEPEWTSNPLCVSPVVNTCQTQTP